VGRDGMRSGTYFPEYVMFAVRTDWVP